eukprot:gene13815-4043_t
MAAPPEELMQSFWSAKTDHSDGNLSPEGRGKLVTDSRQNDLLLITEPSLRELTSFLP